MHSKLYRVFFETRVIGSSSLESNGFRIDRIHLRLEFGPKTSNSCLGIRLSRSRHEFRLAGSQTREGGAMCGSTASSSLAYLVRKSIAVRVAPYRRSLRSSRCSWL